MSKMGERGVGRREGRKNLKEKERDRREKKLVL